MKLEKSQREAVVSWIAEGLQTDEINQRAATFTPPFSVLRSQVDYYRKSRKIKIQEIREAGEFDALKTGLARKSARVLVLQRLAYKMIGDLLPAQEGSRSLLWTDQVKGIGSKDDYERIDYLEFNKAEVDSLRGTLDDLAKELGERRPDVEINTNVTFDLDAWKQTRAERIKDVEAMDDEGEGD